MKYLFILVGGLVVAAGMIMLVTGAISAALVLPHALRLVLADANLVFWWLFMPCVVVVYSIIYLVRSRH